MDIVLEKVQYKQLRLLAKGAVVKSYGIERWGKGRARFCQVCIKDTKTIELLKKYLHINFQRTFLIN